VVIREDSSEPERRVVERRDERDAPEESEEGGQNDKRGREEEIDGAIGRGKDQIRLIVPRLVRFLLDRPLPLPPPPTPGGPEGQGWECEVMVPKNEVDRFSDLTGGQAIQVTLVTQLTSCGVTIPPGGVEKKMNGCHVFRLVWRPVLEEGQVKTWNQTIRGVGVAKLKGRRTCQKETIQAVLQDWAKIASDNDL